MIDSRILEHSVQINNGFTETSGDGASLAFDKKYGIMFCAYMPGFQGHYGESRGKIALSLFPASQPTNIRCVAEYQRRGVTVYERLSTSIYSKRILEALGIEGAIRVSPLHCHGTEDIDEFLRITADMTK